MDEDEYANDPIVDDDTPGAPEPLEPDELEEDDPAIDHQSV